MLRSGKNKFFTLKQESAVFSVSFNGRVTFLMQKVPEMLNSPKEMLNLEMLNSPSFSH